MICFLCRLQRASVDYVHDVPICEGCAKDVGRLFGSIEVNHRPVTPHMERVARTLIDGRTRFPMQAVLTHLVNYSYFINACEALCQCEGLPFERGFGSVALDGSPIFFCTTPDALQGRNFDRIIVTSRGIDLDSLFGCIAISPDAQITIQW